MAQAPQTMRRATRNMVRQSSIPSFLDLPAEIRLLIYEHYIADKICVPFSLGKLEPARRCVTRARSRVLKDRPRSRETMTIKQRRGWPITPTARLHLRQTCRQVCQELSSMYFSRAAASFENTGVLVDAFSTRPSRFLSKIRRLCISMKPLDQQRLLVKYMKHTHSCPNNGFFWAQLTVRDIFTLCPGLALDELVLASSELTLSRPLDVGSLCVSVFGDDNLVPSLTNSTHSWKKLVMLFPDALPIQVSHENDILQWIQGVPDQRGSTMRLMLAPTEFCPQSGQEKLQAYHYLRRCWDPSWTPFVPEYNEERSALSVDRPAARSSKGGEDDSITWLGESDAHRYQCTYGLPFLPRSAVVIERTIAIRPVSKIEANQRLRKLVGTSFKDWRALRMSPYGYINNYDEKIKAPSQPSRRR